MWVASASDRSSGFPFFTLVVSLRIVVSSAMNTFFPLTLLVGRCVQQLPILVVGPNWSVSHTVSVGVTRGAGPERVSRISSEEQLKGLNGRCRADQLGASDSRARICSDFSDE